MDASKRHKTLQSVLDLDVANGTVRTAGSHSRNLRRVRQGLDLIRALFEQFLATEYVPSLPLALLIQVFHKYTNTFTKFKVTFIKLGILYF